MTCEKRGGPVSSHPPPALQRAQARDERKEGEMREGSLTTQGGSVRRKVIERPADVQAEDERGRGEGQKRGTTRWVRWTHISG